MTTAERSLERPRSDRLNGVVYTPAPIAAALVALLDHLGVVMSGDVLEPSVGDGAFLTALTDHGARPERTLAIDIDPQRLNTLAAGRPGLATHCGDFIQYVLDRPGSRFDLIVGNPPYIRRKNFDVGFSETLDALSKRQAYPRPNLKNAWAAFVIAAESVLSQDGALAFVVPYELMNVDYGLALQREVFPRFERIDILVPKEKAFKQIDQDAVVIIARRRAQDLGVFVHDVANLEVKTLGHGTRIDYAPGSPIAINLKAFLLTDQAAALLRRIQSTAPTVADVCRSHTGIVTAANDYFILTREAVERRELAAWAKPILKRSAYLPSGPIFTAEDFARLSQTLPSQVIDFNGFSRQDLTPAAVRYVEEGEASGVDGSYKARNRQTWFHIPMTPKSRGLFFKRSFAYPRLCVNEADAYVTDTAYVIHMGEGRTVEALCYSFYNSLTLLFCEVLGRFYGGGVLELTPKEFRALPLYYSEPTPAAFKDFAAAERWSDPERLALDGDQRLIEQHGFSVEDMAVVHDAWRTLRAHRLRHGASGTLSKQPAPK
ncbi:methylase of polypeptide subunit release factors [Brevundimonas nasdae]|uniref:Eco57I restriction-modification methylase domain-containing protein n=1 Tax=Brevundimonas nasdae TaxID=172043 RepID=UPI0019125B5F|nr:Eco57I restriction-modification methylase domain-containing protein [Brevundimonas nasdae]MBK6025783.1 Eco57I restriction-modification methylase domain-containing protein [Brevundimonas nasdae]MDQ0452366.1 methylase of polypeptide subunit release factors [Brevundimonas nasdae]